MGEGQGWRRPRRRLCVDLVTKLLKGLEVNVSVVVFAACRYTSVRGFFAHPYQRIHGNREQISSEQAEIERNTQLAERKYRERRDIKKKTST